MCLVRLRKHAWNSLELLTRSTTDSRFDRLVPVSSHMTNRLGVSVLLRWWWQTTELSRGPFVFENVFNPDVEKPGDTKS